jgi:hypothetical protein
MDFLEIGQDAFDVVEGVWALGMAGVLDALPGGFSGRGFERDGFASHS